MHIFRRIVMSKKEKLLIKLFDRKKDFTWDELVALLTGLGYNLLQGDGSRVKFFNQDLDSLIILHKPHPDHLVKGYVIKGLIEELEKKGIKP